VIEAFKNNFKTRLRDKSNDSPNQHNETEPEPMEKKNQQELCAGYNLPPKKKIIHHKGEKTKENKTDPISLDHSLIPINTHGSPSQRVPTVIILHQLCSRIDNIHNHIHISHEDMFAAHAQLIEGYSSRRADAGAVKSCQVRQSSPSFCRPRTDGYMYITDRFVSIQDHQKSSRRCRVRPALFESRRRLEREMCNAALLLRAQSHQS
jgi:hypothetical protein